jgi:hypothetical protein
MDSYHFVNLLMDAVVVLTAELGLFCANKSPNGRRRGIDSIAWAILRKYYGNGPEYKCSLSTECRFCLGYHEEAKQHAADWREAQRELRRVDLAPEALSALYERKQGVPEHCIYRKWAFLDDAGVNHIEQFAQHDDHVLPLKSGLYNLVPRNWLRLWRRYVKDITLTALPVLDCTSLICHSNGLLIVPPHLEEYLLGVRKSLLGGLGLYEGEVVEIVCAEEWDELHKISRGMMSDFGIRCCLDGDNVSWSVGVCHICDPFDRASFAVSSNRDLIDVVTSSLPTSPNGNKGYALRSRNLALGAIS